MPSKRARPCTSPEGEVLKLILATNNKNKVREIREILGTRFEEILSLSEAGIVHETVEDGDTFAKNAEKKAREIAELSGTAALADDSGISVDALGGAPGVYSARFAGEHGDDKKNTALLLEKLAGESDRGAHYTAAVALVYPDGRLLSAEGYLFGKIADAPRGTGGFGYDPVFIPEGGNRTLAEYTEDEKNAVSHRARALAALLEKLGE